MTLLEGIDVSNHQGRINWHDVKNAGISFAFMKATQGDDFVDAFYATNLEGCREVGIVPGPYHFYRHDVDPAAQAAHFLNTIGRSQMGEMPPTVDVENTQDGAGPHNYGTAELVRRVGVFLDAVRQGTGRACIIYTYPDAWQTLTGDTNAFANSNPLWISSFNPAPRLVGGWQDFTFWQFTTSGNVQGVGSVDRDRFNGDITQFRNFCGDDVRRFPPPFDNFTLFGEFRKFYEAHGDISAFGNPITNDGPETIGGTQFDHVQWFERARMEWHPELNRPLLGLVGVEALRAKGRDVQSNVSISPLFVNYYTTNGGVEIFGLPIEPEVPERLSGADYQVQYFQRARLELNPQNQAISRGLVGVEARAALM